VKAPEDRFQSAAELRVALEKAATRRDHEARSYLLAVYLNTDARLKSIYSDPRYENLRRRMKLPAPM
jgi:hypothetical protein